MTFDGVTTLSINTVGNSDFSGANLVAAAATNVTITSNASGSIAFTSALEASTGLATLVLSANGTDAADITLGAINASATADKLTSITLSGVSGADVTVGVIELGNGATGAATGTMTLIAGNGSVVGTSATDVTTTGAYTLTLNLDAQASGTIGIGDISMLAGTAATAASTAISLVVAPVTIGTGGAVRVEKVLFDTAGASLTLGAVNVAQSGGFTFGATAIQASADLVNIDVSDINVTLAAEASATFGTILTTAGAVSSITLSVADSASAAMGVINASSVGAISVNVNGDGEVDFAGITAVSNIGAISLTIADEADVTVAAISAGGDIGAITINIGASATANFDTIDASSIGDISISGAGFVDFGAFTATRVGTINATNMTSGTFNLDLSGITNNATVNLGAATNTVLVGKGNDSITLLAGSTGNDHIQFNTTAQDTDRIINFNAGSTGADVFEIFVSAFGGLVVAGSAAAGIATGTVAIDLGFVTAATALAATDNVIVLGTGQYASLAEMKSAIASGGSMLLTLGSATAGNILIAWSDTNGDTNISIVAVGAGATGIASGASAQTIAILQGVTPGALVAANFDFI